MMRKKLILAMLLMLLSSVLSYSQEVGSYLIASNIGEYVFRPKRVITIGNAGLLVPAGHFPGHGDITYEGIYIHPQTYLGVTVQVTKHTGSDSDKWLLHEMENAYRDNDDTDKRLGLLSGAGVKIREINGNKFLYWGLGGGSYAWISGQIVIEIKYTDLQRTKPEPIEVVQAYLQKYASSIPATVVLDSAHDTIWIKDEMDRRLWLCDKWFYQLQLKKVEEKKVYQESVKSMNIFLDYREKYYGMKAADEKNLLAGYLNTNNGTDIKVKLDEYKKWWVVNKDKAISLSLTYRGRTNSTV